MASAYRRYVRLTLAWVAVIAMTSLVLRFGWGRSHAIVGAFRCWRWNALLRGGHRGGTKALRPESH